jgi:sugar lactone lactonase YvrE
MFSRAIQPTVAVALRWRTVAWLAFWVCVGPFFCSAPRARADLLLVTNVFFNSVDLYHGGTGQLVTAGFFAPSVEPGQVLYLADVVVNPLNNRAYVSANFPDETNTTRIYHFDALTGTPLPSPVGGSDGVFLEFSGGSVSPAGLALDSAGNVYVANQGGVTVDKYDLSGNHVRSYGDNGASVLYPTGLAFGPDGTLFVTNFGTGATVNVDVDTGDIVTVTTPGQNGPTAPNGIAVGPGGESYVADVFGNHVFKFDSHGTEITRPDGTPFITIDLGEIPGATHPNAPSGLTFDADGNLLVGVLGPTNPFQDGSNGALLRFSVDDGSLLQTLGFPLPPAGGLAFVVPEPSALVLFVVGCLGVACWGRQRRRRHAVT